MLANDLYTRAEATIHPEAIKAKNRSLADDLHARAEAACHPAAM
jgi:hypothetical protein